MAKSRYKLVHETYMGTPHGGMPPCRVAIYRDNEKKQYRITQSVDWRETGEDRVFIDSKTEARKVAAKLVREIRKAPACKRNLKREASERRRRGY